MSLTLDNDGQITRGIDAGGHAFQYSVSGLPPGENAQIALLDGCWRILRWNDEWHGNWSGEYPTAEAALAELQKDIRSTAS